jgi:hypothetical protein
MKTYIQKIIPHLWFDKGGVARTFGTKWQGDIIWASA